MLDEQDPTKIQNPPQQPNDPPWLKDHEERMQTVYAREKIARDNELLGAFRSAVTADPKAEAQAAAVAQRLGRPRETLGDDLQVAQEIARLGELQEFYRTNPELDRFLRNSQTVRMLHDDLGKLKLVTETFDGFRRNYESGETINEAGLLKAQSAFRQLTTAEQDRLNEIEAIQAMAELETGVFDEASKILGQMVTPMLQAAAVGAVAGGATSALTGPGAVITGPTAFVTGSLSTVFAHSALIEFGHEFATIKQQLIDKGVDPTEAHEVAKGMAAAYGIGAAFVETASTAIIGKPFVGAGRKIAGKLLGQTGLAQETATSAGARFLKETLAGLAAEPIEEGIQQLMSAGFENLAGSVKGVDSGPSFDEALAQTGDVMLKTLKGMSLIAPLGPAVHFAADLRRVQEAQGAKALFDRLAETVNEVETLKRSPETFAQMVAAKVEGTRAANVYIEGPKLAQALAATGQTREQLAADLPDVERQLRDAEKTGDDVVIPMGDFAAKIAGSELYPAIQKSIRLQKDGFSQEQAEEWTAEQAQNREATAAKIGELAVRGVEWQKQGDAVEHRMLTEVQKDTRLQPQVAKFLASRYRLFVEAQAERTGQTPAQFDAENRLTFSVQRDRQRESAHLFQDKDGSRRLNTPEFKEWFGESKVVDETGAPKRVLHGTTRTFTSFDTEHANPESDFGRGFYFSDEESDVGVNFAGVGPDLTNRIERRAERLEAEGADPEEAAELARKELTEHEGATVPVYLSLRNPVVIGETDETRFDMEENYDEETDTFGEPTGSLVDFIQALRDAASKYYDGEVDTVIEKLVAEQSLPASKLVDIVTNDETFGYYTDELGEMVSREILRDAFERMGFDGIVDRTVDKKFGSQRRVGQKMKGMGPSTTHFVAFRPEQIKSVNNRGTWSRESRNILHQKKSTPITFYSALKRAIETLDVAALKAEDWKARLTGLQSQGVIRQQERFWTGIDEFLDLQSYLRDGAKISRRALLDHLDKAGVDVQARTKSSTGPKLWKVLDESGSTVDDGFSSEEEAKEKADELQSEEIERALGDYRIEVEMIQDGDLPFDEEAASSVHVGTPLLTFEEWKAELFSTYAGYLATHGRRLVPDVDTDPERVTEEMWAGLKEALAAGDEEKTEMVQESYESYAEAWEFAQEEAENKRKFEAGELSTEDEWSISYNARTVSYLPTQVRARVEALATIYTDEDDANKAAEEIRDLLRDHMGDYNSYRFYVAGSYATEEVPFSRFVIGEADAVDVDYTVMSLTLDSETDNLFDPSRVGHSFDDSEMDKNRLAHVRYSTRPVKMPDGYKAQALFVEEIQSDWADAARDAGMLIEVPPRRETSDAEKEKAQSKLIEARSAVGEAERDFEAVRFKASEAAEKDSRGSDEVVENLRRVHQAEKKVALAKEAYTLAALEKLYVVDAAEKTDSQVFQLATISTQALHRWREDAARADMSLAELEYDRTRRDSPEFEVVEQKLRDATAAYGKVTALVELSDKPTRPGPFINSSDAWIGLAWKQILLTAAREGFGVVALANGPQAASVYSLEKDVNRVTWAVDQNRRGAVKKVTVEMSGGGTLRFWVDAAGVMSDVSDVRMNHMNHKKMAAAVGKDVAAKILATWKGDEADGVLDAQELGETAIGGLGMRAFYGDGSGYKTTSDDKVVFNAKGAPEPAIAPKVLRDLTKKIEGIEQVSVELLGDGSGITTMKNFAVTLSPEAVEKVKEGFPLFQKDDELQGAYDPMTNEAFIYEAGDASTFWHEMNHFWLTTLFRMASKPEASVSVRRDAQVLLDWFGVKDIDTWNSMSLDEQRRHHEAFARTGELILHEGKAPDVNEEQLRLFQVVARWIRRAYRYLRDTLNAQHKKTFGVDLPVLTAEVRAVYDRMLVAEDTIAAAEAQRAMAPLFRDKPEGMSDLDWAEYQLHGDVGHETAIGKLIQTSLSTMKWLSGARDKLKKGVNREARKLRASIEDAERKAAQQEPVYVARRALERGESVEPDGTIVPVQMPKLDAAAVVSILVNNDLPLDALDRVSVDKGGVHPDVVAEMLGFGSGESMVQALASAPDLDTAVQQRTDARMLAEHSDLADQEAIDRKIEEVLHNEARGRMVAAELRFLGKIITPVRVMLRAAKTHAREVLGRKRIGSVHQHEHVQAEVRHRREAEKALKKGEHASVVLHKRKELLEGQMAREALTIRQEIDDARKVFRKLFKPDAKLAKTRNVDYIAIARALVAAFGLQPGEKLADSYVQQLRAYNPEMFERLEPILDRARQWAEDAAEQGRDVKTWKDLTVDEFRDLTETVEALWHQSLREQQFAAEGKKLDLGVVAARVREQNEKTSKRVEPLLGAETPGEKRASGFRRLLFLATRPEHWAWRKDGANKAGAFTRYFWRPVRDAVNRYVHDRNRYTKRVADMVRKLRPKLKLGTIEFKDAQGNVLHVFGRGNGGFGQAELIAALLHTGNEGNLRRLILGRKWGSYDPETETLDASAWQAFVEEQVQAGVITKDVMDFVQAVWDLNEELKPLAQKAHRDMLGFYFKEVEAVPVRMPFGNYRGGYMPAKLDASARSAGRVASLRDIEQDYRKQFATTGRGFTKERSEVFAEPLLLDLDLVPAHIDDVLRFAHIQPAVRDVEKLAKHPDVAESLHATQPEVWDRFLLPWLQRVASQSATKRGVSPDLDSFMRAVRSSAGMSVMFANIANTLQQLTGLLSAALRVKPRFLFRAFWKLLTERGAFLREIADASPGFMGQRQKAQIFDSVEAINDLMQNRGKFAKLRAWAKRNAYIFQSTMQNLVDAVAWGGAYEQALEQQGRTVSDAEAHVEAVKQADAAVRMTQSSFDPTDVAGYEEQTPFGKLFTMFSGYFNTMANLQADQLVRIGQATGMAKAGLAFQAYLLGFAAPMLLADAITRTMRDQWDDEDEDGDVDVLTADFLLLGQLRSALAEVPVAGPNVLAPMVGWFDDDEVWNDRMTSSPAVSLFERAGQGTVRAVKTAFDPEKDIEGRNVRDVLTLLGVLFGVPTFGRQIGYGVDVMAGEVEPTVRGVLTGVAPR